MDIKKLNWFWVIIVGIILFLGASMIVGYNRMMDKMEMAEVALSDVDAMMQRKVELLPGFVTLGKNITSLGDSMEESVKKVKEHAYTVSSVKEKSELNRNLSQMVSEVMEKINAEETISSGEELLTYLHDYDYAENKLNEYKTTYNDYAKEYNLMLHQFPHRLVANFFSMEEKDYFEMSDYLIPKLESFSQHLQISMQEEMKEE